jgi:hypothetical protein
VAALYSFASRAFSAQLTVHLRLCGCRVTGRAVPEYEWRRLAIRLRVEYPDAYCRSFQAELQQATCWNWHSKKVIRLRSLAKPVPPDDLLAQASRLLYPNLRQIAPDRYPAGYRPWPVDSRVIGSAAHAAPAGDAHRTVRATSLMPARMTTLSGCRSITSTWKRSAICPESMPITRAIHAADSESLTPPTVGCGCR